MEATVLRQSSQPGLNLFIRAIASVPKSTQLVQYIMPADILQIWGSISLGTMDTASPKPNVHWVKPVIPTALGDVESLSVPGTDKIFAGPDVTLSRSSEQPSPRRCMIIRTPPVDFRIIPRQESGGSGSRMIVSQS